MLNHPTRDKLITMKLSGMAAAFDEQRQSANYDAMTFEERLGLLVDRELTARNNRQLTMRLKLAKLRQSALAEDIDFRQPRGLDRSLFQTLLQGEWLRRHDNCLITGPSGVGKSYLACALGHQACRSGLTVLYARVPRLFPELAIARADGSYRKRLAALARTDLLLFDDWGLAPFAPDQVRDLLEILDDRYDRKSTLIVSQVPVDAWHQLLGDPTLADAILDRLVHNAHRLELAGDSMRKTRATNHSVSPSTQHATLTKEERSGS